MADIRELSDATYLIVNHKDGQGNRFNTTANLNLYRQFFNRVND